MEFKLNAAAVDILIQLNSTKQNSLSRFNTRLYTFFHVMFSAVGICLNIHRFRARCNIYFSRLCYDVSVRLSVRLSVTFVHCGHRVQWIPDTFACLDRWMSLLFTDNASPGSSGGMMPGFLVEEGGGVWKNW